MPQAPHPADESRRQATLDQLGLLDTGADPVFDELVRRAASTFDTPMAAISLVDHDRQWFKARVGLDVEQTPRSCAICAYCILGEGPLVIQDTKQDPGVADNPLVTGPPHLRFYAGAPIRWTDGQHIGSLCTLDTRPRNPSAKQIERLIELAQEVSYAIDHHFLRLCAKQWQDLGLNGDALAA
ncbi:MAG: GAF domain-containing protein [Planctomycetota bacterium]